MHYIICHAKRKRVRRLVRGQALIDGRISAWKGPVWMDGEKGNWDPYVLHRRWLWSYCQLYQRKISLGSYVFFCCTDAANRGYLLIDTVFVVGDILEWPQGNLPRAFRYH